ncbi:MAG: hypothetical protein M3N53_03400 [Actinomycetota bacterium]|nr:hypothetical protein [Actinomycetota bacterium]
MNIQFASEAWHRLSHMSHRTIAIGSVLLLALVVAIVLAVTANGEADRPAGERPASEPELSMLENEDGSYEVSYPPGWSPRTSATRTIITSPDGDAVVGVGLGTEGKLQDTARNLLASLRRSYDGLTIDARRSESFGDKRAFLVSGSAKNLSGVALRWLAVSLREGERNFTVTIFSDANARPEQLIPPLESIVSSIRSI